ncbi:MULTISPECIES: DUF3310 domain-containing protein [Acidaminococcus]|jgi:hypothetical protein|uniref:DUF3310 domain-containing protein n=1 Tax=Acidaminococcus TaxID=904 RepID=UPI00034EB539|nr:MULTISPECIES: DUF3310 domain-containing protein [Acidaminococcus]EPD71907.1 hypothetical protein HMPREF1479_01433 [Acidaminococcus sp. HPA0509]MCB5829244.1 DUF3310 domain-containing protein [Acidaminococcus intestini]DAH12537.1 MAG TPA: nucelotide kinase [Caudoviricetes sp.]
MSNTKERKKLLWGAMMLMNDIRRCKGCMFYLHEPGRGCRISDDIPCDWELRQQPVWNVPDPVHHPPHYSWRGFKGIDLIKKFVKRQEDAFLAVCEANIIKYLYRYPRKNNIEDLRKIAEYATMAADYLEENGGGEEDA